jgi:hypothetical protein
MFGKTGRNGSGKNGSSPPGWWSPVGRGSAWPQPCSSGITLHDQLIPASEQLFPASELLFVASEKLCTASGHLCLQLQNNCLQQSCLQLRNSCLQLLNTSEQLVADSNPISTPGKQTEDSLVLQLHYWYRKRQLTVFPAFSSLRQRQFF